MSSRYFERSLEMGKTFEDIVEPVIAREFASRDNQAYYMNKANSKLDVANNRGQRYKNCVDTRDSLPCPDMEVHACGKQIHVEIKCKSSWVNLDGIQYAVIDAYKVREYEIVKDITHFDECIYVFGDKRSRSVYMTDSSYKGELRRIPFFKDAKNPNQQFICWDISKLKYLGKW